jgi:uncharacterized protein with NRDE domain
MCLIAFNWKNHPRYKLILIANRDEFYQRKTLSAHFWDENREVLAGKDLEGGGTWLGITKSGYWSALTNYRDIANLKSQAPSRGMLTFDFLNQKPSPTIYLSSIAEKAPDYNGFNLLVGNTEELCYYSNYQSEIRSLGAGLYGLSNHLLDTDWYKVEKIKDKLQKAIQDDMLEQGDLFDLLFDKEKPEDARVQQTGLPLDRERMLSSMFIESPNYGTCSSTVLLIDYQNQAQFFERVYNTQDKIVRENSFTFKIES